MVFELVLLLTLVVIVGELKGDVPDGSTNPDEDFG